jgi:hypothetical protein
LKAFREDSGQSRHNIVGSEGKCRDSDGEEDSSGGGSLDGSEKDFIFGANPNEHEPEILSSEIFDFQKCLPGRADSLRTIEERGI